MAHHHRPQLRISYLLCRIEFGISRQASSNLLGEPEDWQKPQPHHMSLATFSNVPAGIQTLAVVRKKYHYPHQVFSVQLSQPRMSIDL